jgi:hypothetical protein
MSQRFYFRARRRKAMKEHKLKEQQLKEEREQAKKKEAELKICGAEKMQAELVSILIFFL